MPSLCIAVASFRMWNESLVLWPTRKWKYQNATNDSGNPRSITSEPHKLRKTVILFASISSQVSLASEWKNHKIKRWIINSCDKIKSMTSLGVLPGCLLYSILTFPSMAHSMSGFSSTTVNLSYTSTANPPCVYSGWDMLWVFDRSSRRSRLYKPPRRSHRCCGPNPRIFPDDYASRNPKRFNCKYLYSRQIAYLVVTYQCCHAQEMYINIHNSAFISDVRITESLRLNPWGWWVVVCLR